MDDIDVRTLHAALTAQRAHILAVVGELDDGALRRPTLPSGWSCLALVQHLAADVEEFWFQTVVRGDPQPDRPASGWTLAADATPASVVEGYRRAIAAADEILASTAWRQPPAYWPEQFGPDFHLRDVHAIVVHVLTETACHAGHLDAARELLDGGQWLVLP